MNQLFQDRFHAGRLLSQQLGPYAHRPDVIVVGLPRGGVPVAFEVARALNAPLDVFIVRKLGLPGHAELAMGAIATGGVRVLNKQIVEELNIPDSVIDAVAHEQERELRRREVAYRGHGDSPGIAGHTVSLVDDGIATGSPIRAAARAGRSRQSGESSWSIQFSIAATCASGAGASRPTTRRGRPRSRHGSVSV